MYGCVALDRESVAKTPYKRRYCTDICRLVAYFSASGVTAKVAENLADAIGADIFEIQPEVPYTKADLNWMDKKSRSTIEMSDPASRPVIAAKRDNMDEYDTIFVGLQRCTKGT